MYVKGILIISQKNQVSSLCYGGTVRWQMFRFHHISGGWVRPSIPINIEHPYRAQLPLFSKTPITSIAVWVEAMITFQAILLHKPHKVLNIPHFLYYVIDVKGIAAEGWDWSLYNTKYRGLCTVLEQWFIHRLDLCNVFRCWALQVQKQHTFAKNNQMPQRPLIPAQTAVAQAISQGYCFNYHSLNTRCTRPGYTYKLLCYICVTAEHPSFLCRFGKSTLQYQGQSDSGQKTQQEPPKQESNNTQAHQSPTLTMASSLYKPTTPINADTLAKLLNGYD